MRTPKNISLTFLLMIESNKVTKAKYEIKGLKIESIFLCVKLLCYVLHI